MLCPVDPPNELSDLRVVLGISNTSIEWHPSSFSMMLSLATMKVANTNNHFN